MEKKMTLEEALVKISELENECAELKARVEELEKRKPAGRKVHGASWTASYNDFVVDYEAGKTLIEIINMGKISRRTAYRYKAYYESVNNKE